MLTIILLAILAGVVLYHFYNVLGTKGDGDIVRQKEIQALFQALTARAEKLTTSSKDLAEDINKDAAESITVDALTQIWPNFDAAQFLQGAGRAFKQILDAYHAGDILSVADLLSPAVLKAFESSNVEDFERHSGEHTISTLEDILEAEIQEITLSGEQCRITVLFVSEQRVQTRDAKGKPIPDTPDYAAEVQDLWVFEKLMQDKKTAWTLVATRNAV